MRKKNLQIVFGRGLYYKLFYLSEDEVFYNIDDAIKFAKQMEKIESAVFKEEKTNA